MSEHFAAQLNNKYFSDPEYASFVNHLASALLDKTISPHELGGTVVLITEICGNIKRNNPTAADNFRSDYE